MRMAPMGASVVMQRAVVLLAIGAPMVMAALMIANCWAHGRTREVCDPDGQVPEMVQQVTTTVFAWLATPPQ